MRVYTLLPGPVMSILVIKCTEFSPAILDPDIFSNCPGKTETGVSSIDLAETAETSARKTATCGC